MAKESADFRHLIWFEDLRREDVAEVGGKNSSLGEMVSQLEPLGVKVPGGFATTSDAFRLYVKQNDLGNVIKETMEYLRENYQSIDHYLDLHGFDESWRQKLRKSMSI